MLERVERQYHDFDAPMREIRAERRRGEFGIVPQPDWRCKPEPSKFLMLADSGSQPPIPANARVPLADFPENDAR